MFTLFSSVTGDPLSYKLRLVLEVGCKKDHGVARRLKDAKERRAEVAEIPGVHSR
jgi:hypothetical protein